MVGEQLLLAFVCGVLGTLGVYFLSRFVFVTKSIDKYFYFAVCALSAAMFSFFQLQLSFSGSAKALLGFQAGKFAFIILAALFWFFCMLEVFEIQKKLRVIKKIMYWLWPALLMALLINFYVELSHAPYVVSKIGIVHFVYLQGSALWFYYLLAVCMTFVVVAVLVAVWISLQPKRKKYYATLMTFPLLLGGINDFWNILGKREGRLITEYLVVLFIILLCYHFIAEEYRNNLRLKTMKVVLEKEVRQRTEQLNMINTELWKRNVQMWHDFEMARRIQQSMLPQVENFPHQEAVIIKGRYQSMAQLGGDLYDIIPVGEEKIGILMADVSGHGVSSALITSMVKVSFGANARAGFLPSTVCQRVNEEMVHSIGDLGHYVTAMYALLNPLTGEFKYANAGHHPALWFQSSTKQIKKLKTSGIFIGMFPGLEYDYEKITLSPGDRILFYTDGVIEVRNEDKAFYGIDRLIEFLQRNGFLGPDDFLDELTQDVERFSGHGDINDDRALLLLDFHGKSPLAGGPA